MCKGILALAVSLVSLPIFAADAPVPIPKEGATPVLGTSPGPMALTPSEMKWASAGRQALPGMEQVTLVGDPSKPGPYTLRLKFPNGYKVAPHTHPDAREITILSGTWCIGYGEKFDSAALKELPAGSFYMEPANVPHFLETRGNVLIQVSGMGPSGRKFINPADAPK